MFCNGVGAHGMVGDEAAFFGDAERFVVAVMFQDGVSQSFTRIFSSRIRGGRPDGEDKFFVCYYA